MMNIKTPAPEELPLRIILDVEAKSGGKDNNFPYFCRPKNK
jgi:hypothetical protein